MPDLTPGSPEHNVIFVVTARPALKELIDNRAGVTDLLLDAQLWRVHASRFSNLGNRSIRGAEEFQKILFLWTVWETYTEGGRAKGVTASCVQEIIPWPNCSVEHFDVYWEIQTFHGFTDSCEYVLRRMCVKDIETVRNLVGPIASSWLDSALADSNSN